MGARPEEVILLHGVAAALIADPALAEAAPDEAQAKAMKALEIDDLALALLCVPTGYQDCANPIEDLHEAPAESDKGLFLLRRGDKAEALDAGYRQVSSRPHESIFDAPYRGYWDRVRQLRLEVLDRQGRSAWISRFDPWTASREPRTGSILVEGHLRRNEFDGRLYVMASSFLPAAAIGRIWPRYSLPGAPKEAVVRELVNMALARPEAAERCAMAVVSRTLLSQEEILAFLHQRCAIQASSVADFIVALHWPQTLRQGQRLAQAARLLATAGVCNAARIASARAPNPRSVLSIARSLQDSLVRSQPETLTDDQARVVAQLFDALRDPRPLNGLLSGDVGTGKTLAFAIPAVGAHMSGGRVAIISPTEILANQLASNLQRRFPQAKVERVRAGKRIVDDAAILVGTSGLGTVARKSGYQPDLLIVDEQHKLATEHRDALLAPWTHRLEASATPIPRSLASTLFNGMRVFNLHQAPVQRQIDCDVIQERERGQVVSWMRQAMAEGHRVAVIYPRVSPEQVSKAQKDEDAAAVDELLHRSWAEPGKEPAQAVTSVTGAAANLAQHFGKVGMLHGRLPVEEIDATLQAFREGAVQLVVASTIMETGIDVPDIRLLIVKDAHCFGAAQLHQLRGRLARNGGRGRFVMMVSDVLDLPEATFERLVTVRDERDGYKLAEADMKARGIGELAGLAQSGQGKSAFRLLKLRLADFQRHAKMQAQTPV